MTPSADLSEANLAVFEGTADFELTWRVMMDTLETVTDKSKMP